MNQCSVFELNLMIQPGPLLQSVKPLALIDIVGKKTRFKGEISSYQIGSELSEITHFWCLFWYLCFSLHQTLIWIRWRLCLGQDHQFLPLFSHTRKKQQTSREKLHKKGESNETKVNMR